MTRSFVHGLARSLLWSFAVGAGVGALRAWALYYPQNGLYRIALDVGLDTLAPVLWIGLSCGLASQGLRFADARARRSPGRGRLALRVLVPSARVVATYPLFLWMVFRSGDLLSLSSGFQWLGAAGLLVIYLGREWVRERGGREPAREAAGWGGVLVTLVCLLGLIPLRALDRWWPPTSTLATPRPNILLIVLDTLRADRLSCFGYPRATSPELDDFAREAIRFPNFYSTSVWTVPSHASLFTGLYPIRHGATQERIWLDSRFATLAEVFRNAGYRTWGASANAQVSPHINLTQGFDDFVDTWRQVPRPSAGEADLADPSAHVNNLEFARFLGRRPKDRPFFAFINYVEAHVPLTPPPPYLQRFVGAGVDLRHALRLGSQRPHEHYVGEPHPREDLAILSDLYDGEIAYLSRVVGDLIAWFRRDSRFENTVIVITSDHGEHFGENGLVGHMFGLYNTAVRIPLLIRLPHGVRGGEVEPRNGQLVDLFPTLLNAAGIDFAGLPQPEIDLLAEGGARREAILSEYYYPREEFALFSNQEYESSREQLAPFMRRLRAIQLYGFRFIWSSDGRHEFYNVLRDPLESENLLTRDVPPAMAEEMQSKLAEAFGALLDPGVPDPIDRPPVGRKLEEPELDPQTRDALRRLGYLR